ncbi:sigma-54-dependent transcriptional regulator [Chondromyces crocatus]|uniref:Fis family transcriptional regulator n=1 Tax=Chondromyces crocatus TaxID=52 RepID=A0A0K1EC27_CHOCO|nr:sigma-54 dependent transcriptional regulator [Chondromyces crocatus]AKT38441.1 Fis family transcriptional regulator [Chondromyces crocatus]
MLDLDLSSFDVLVVDDEQDNLDAFRFTFRRSFRLNYARGGVEALEMLDRIDPAVILSDQRMPGMAGIDFLERAKQRRPDAFGILLTAYADIQVLVDAVNSGAVDRYIQKPWNSKELTAIIRQGIQVFSTKRENRRLREQLALYRGYLEREQRDPIDFGELVGDSRALQQVTTSIAEVASTSTHVLIEGEQGSEKDVVARAIHVGSSREEQPFVRVTCAAFRGEALERELFGWRRGAFEGAFGDRAGRLELAHGGTIYLDEPWPLTSSLQARLLRFLSDGQLERIGATDTLRVDVRVVLAVTTSFSETWGRGEVLPELVTRLSVFPIRLPPLRERPGDIPMLAEHFLRKYARRNARAATSLSEEAIAKLKAYAWPGNARELENVIERAAILSRGDVIQPEHLAYTPRPPLLAPSPLVETDTASPVSASVPPPSSISGKGGPASNLSASLEEYERQELLTAMARCNGNKAEVARYLGVQRTTLYYRLKRLGIDG